MTDMHTDSSRTSDFFVILANVALSIARDTTLPANIRLEAINISKECIELSAYKYKTIY